MGAFLDWMDRFASGLQAGGGRMGGAGNAWMGARQKAQEQAENEAFKQALQNVDDWNSVVQQIGQANPQKGLELALADRKLQHENTLTPYQKRMIELQEQKLKLEDGRTTSMKDYEYFTGLTPEEQEQYLRLKKAGGTNIELTPYDKEMQKLQAQQDIEREQEEQSRISELEAVKRTRDELFGENGLVKKANLGYKDAEDVGGRLLGVAKRTYPTSLLNPDQQRARQQIMNVLGQLRLDQMKYLKGAISDKEQQMMADIVSGDISKYSPYEIEGTFNAIINRLENAGKTREPQEQEEDVDYKTYFGG